MKLTRELEVINKAGLHLRVASMITKAAKNCDCDVFLANQNYKANCKSCMDLLAIMAPCGTTLTLEVEGEQAEKVADIFTQMFVTKFGEDEFSPEENEETSDQQKPSSVPT